MKTVFCSQSNAHVWYSFTILIYIGSYPTTPNENGAVTFYILLSLYTPKHGYAVMQFIEEKTGGRLSLGAGTLYGALNSLQEKEWIKPCGDCEGRKKEYIITSLGKEVAEKELVRLEELVGVASGIIGGTV